MNHVERSSSSARNCALVTVACASSAAVAVTLVARPDGPGLDGQVGERGRELQLLRDLRAVVEDRPPVVHGRGGVVRVWQPRRGRARQSRSPPAPTVCAHPRSRRTACRRPCRARARPCPSWRRSRRSRTATRRRRRRRPGCACRRRGRSRAASRGWRARRNARRRLEPRARRRATSTASRPARRPSGTPRARGC